MATSWDLFSKPCYANSDIACGLDISAQSQAWATLRPVYGDHVSDKGIHEPEDGYRRSERPLNIPLQPVSQPVAWDSTDMAVTHGRHSLITTDYSHNQEKCAQYTGNEVVGL